MAEPEPTPPAEPDSQSGQAEGESLDAPAADENALNTPESTLEDGVVDATNSKPLGTPVPSPPKGGLKRKLQKFNLYFVLFIFILVLAGGIIVIAYFQSKKASTTSTLKTQTLTAQSLKQVSNGDATVGNTSQVLNVESSAVFAGKVLVRDDLDVAGSLQIGGAVSLNSITVTGAASLGQTQISQNLSVTGDSAFQGAATIAKSLQVTGTGTFGGALSAPQITTSSLQLNSDLVLTHHITTGGGTPNRIAGPALGSGGSASVSGSDTGGTIGINTGSAPAAGCFVTVTFTSKYNSVPHVLLTPVGSAGGGLAYYVTRDSASFSICDATTPPAGASFGFDYFVVD